jgi:hypothetical protein
VAADELCMFHRSRGPGPLFPPRPVIRRSRAIGLVDPHGDMTTHGRVPFSIAARDRDGVGRQASRHRARYTRVQFMGWALRSFGHSRGYNNGDGPLALSSLVVAEYIRPNNNNKSGLSKVWNR